MTCTRHLRWMPWHPLTRCHAEKTRSMTLLRSARCSTPSPTARSALWQKFQIQTYNIYYNTLSYYIGVMSMFFFLFLFSLMYKSVWVMYFFSIPTTLNVVICIWGALLLVECKILPVQFPPKSVMFVVFRERLCSECCQSFLLSLCLPKDSAWVAISVIRPRHLITVYVCVLN